MNDLQQKIKTNASNNNNNENNKIAHSFNLTYQSLIKLVTIHKSICPRSAYMGKFNMFISKSKNNTPSIEL